MKSYQKILCSILILSAGGLGLIYGYRELNRNPLDANNIIRLHVIANSDSFYDQQVKLLVRDEIVQYMTPYFKCAGSTQEARNIARTKIPAIEQIANRCLNGQLVGYSASAELGSFDFPTKAYGKIVLPEGNYEALRVVLGEGKGRNWWCVLFPPLCFVDMSHSMAVKQEEKIAVPGETREVSGEGVRIEIRFRFLDWWHKLGSGFTL